VISGAWNNLDLARRMQLEQTRARRGKLPDVEAQEVSL